LSWAFLRKRFSSLSSSHIAQRAARGLDADRLDRRIDAVLALQPVRGDVDELLLPNSFAFYWVTLCPPMRCTA
jgi:hypothetical protein